MNTINQAMAYTREIPELGTFELRPFSIQDDVEFLHNWVNQPYAQYWGMLNSSIEEVRKAYVELLETPGYEVLTAFWQGEPIFITECYAVEHDLIAQHYEVQKGDRGMHVLVGPPKRKIAGFTWQVFTTIMEFLFADENVQRVVVEPDIRNDKIHALNKRAGFVYDKVLELPHKTAHLAFCTREQFTNAMQRDQLLEKKTVEPEGVTSQLEMDTWEKVNRWLVRKAISEFAHELLLTPEPLDEACWYRIRADNATVEYRFKAEKFILDHWHIHTSSIQKKVNGEDTPLDVLNFITEFQEQLGIPPQFRATYLEEISSTLLGYAYKWRNQYFTAEQLITADFQGIEHAMTEGHPCFVANNGRMGFSTEDYQRYSPEANRPFRLIWLAGHQDYAQYTGIAGLSYKQLLLQELGEAQVRRFHEKLQSLGLSPQNYVLMPVHPWQWNNKLVNLFAADIAQQKLVYLGEGEDQFSAQQSVRTLYNLSNPTKHYTKTALGITNMGFVRGLSPNYMKSTPPITDWICDLLDKDDYLKTCGFEMLDEVATVGYANAHFEAFGTSYPQNKMLAALWRESPAQKTQSHQQVMTMAAFLHQDNDGQALLPLLIQASGVTTREWVKAYLQCYLAPLVHCFYTYGLVFMPHGENLIMVLEEGLPVRALMKDITEEVLVYDENLALPEKVKRLYTEASDEMQILSLFTDVFDCFFRFLGAILHTQGKYSEDLFWEQVAECVLEYQQQHPEHQAKYERYDFFVPTFKRCCLNRLQLSNHKHMLNLADPINSLQFASVLENPIAQYKPQLIDEN